MASHLYFYSLPYHQIKLTVSGVKTLSIWGLFLSNWEWSCCGQIWMWVQSCWLFFNPCQTGDVDGSLEAISDALKTYKSKMVKLTVLSSQVGTVTESDIKLAETFHGKKTEIYFLFSELQMFIHTLPMYKSVHNYSGSSKLLQLVLLLLLFLSLSIYHHCHHYCHYLSFPPHANYVK